MTTTQANADTNMNPVLVYRDALRRHRVACDQWRDVAEVTRSFWNGNPSEIVAAAQAMPTKDRIIEQATAMKQAKEDVEAAWNALDDEGQFGLVAPPWLNWLSVRNATTPAPQG